MQMTKNKKEEAKKEKKKKLIFNRLSENCSC